MHVLQKMFHDAGITTRSYSGRGMYGKVCLAVTVDGDLGPFIADVLEAAQSLVYMENSEDIIEEFRCMATDSMGRGTVAYFPGVPYDETGEAEDEDDE